MSKISRSPRWILFSVFLKMKPLKIGIGYLTRRTLQSPRTVGRWLRKTLEISGPTYIKIGQFIGNRPDLFGKELSEEVSKLQNQAKTFEAQKPVNVYTMNMKPIASASIAQVHSGNMKDGRKIAVKIKRPDVEKQLLDELQTIRLFLNIVEQIMPEFNVLTSWFKDFERGLLTELDFTNEVKNIQLFYELYRFNPEIRVPRVVPNMSGRDHIVMEFVPSTPIKTCKNPKNVTTNLMNSFIEQILYNGLIHGDLHSGNVGIQGDDTIVLYDFGNVIRIPEFYQKAMRDVIVACQNKDSKALLDAMNSMKMKIIDEKAAEEFTRKFFEYLDTLDPKSFSYSKNDIMVPVELDPITLTILRTYSLVEGICREIYPQFTYEQVIQQNIELLFLDQLING